MWVNRKEGSRYALSVGVSKLNKRNQFQQCSCPCKIVFHKCGESSRKCRRMSLERMSSKFKELRRLKGSLRRKTERLCKRIQQDKKASTNLTPKKRLVHVVSKASENSYSWLPNKLPPPFLLPNFLIFFQPHLPPPCLFEPPSPLTCYSKHFFTRLYRNWRSQYKHFSIKI